MKSPFVLIALAAFAIPTFTHAAKPAEPEIIAEAPGVTIDIYQVSPTKQKGARYINTKSLPRLGYVSEPPAQRIERLRSVKRIHTTVREEIESADGKRRTVSNTVPAIEMTLKPKDATEFTKLMKRSIGQRLYIEAKGKPIYAPLVRDAVPRTTLTFSLADDAQLEEVYRKLAPFVKK
jgi:hypothetical protein